MAKPYYITRKEERQELLQQLRDLDQKDLDDQVKEKLQSFLNQMTALDKRLGELSVLNRQGVPTVITKELRDELERLYTETGKAGETFLTTAAKAKLPLNQGAPQVVNSLQGLLSKDHNALLHYNPTQLKTMPELLEDARTQTVELGGREFKTLGNMQNSRIPMTLKTASGQKKNGVFTKANSLRVMHRYYEVLNKAKAACGKNEAAKQQLDQFFAAYKRFLIKGKKRTRAGELYTEQAPDALVLGGMIRYEKLAAQDTEEEYQVTHLDSRLKKLGFNPESIPAKARKSMANGLWNMIEARDIDINAHNLMIDEGQRLDSRNSAMSVVADLVGASSVVARAVPMRFRGADGQIQEGTFMDFAKGIDLGNNGDLVKHLNRDPLSNPDTRGRFLKSVADLQVVDYLCLNVDRHEGNLMFQVDEKGNLIGVQAFDNDSSFGARRQDEDEATYLRYISSSMAAKVKAMTPEGLRFALRGRGLSEAELDAAGKRLKDLQTAINDCLVKVIPDQEFRTRTEKELAPKGCKNLFSRIFNFTKEAIDYAKEEKIPFEAYREQEPDLASVSSMERRFTVGGIVDAAENVSRLLHDRHLDKRVEDLTSNRFRTSPEFKAMVEAARMTEQLLKLYRKAGEAQGQAGEDRNLAGGAQNAPKEKRGLELEPLQEDQLLENAPSSTIENFSKVFKNLREKTETYLDHKVTQRKAADYDSIVPKNDYEGARIDQARKFLAVVKDFENMLKGPQNEAEREEKNRLIDQRNLADRRNAAMEAAKPKEGVPAQPQGGVVPG